MIKLLVLPNTIVKGRAKQIWFLTLVALLITLIGVGWPALLQAESVRTLNLGSLSIADQNGTIIDIGIFDPEILSYSIEVTSTVDRVTVAATAEGSDAGVRIAPEDRDSAEGHQVSLSHGQNIIIVGVTSWLLFEPLRTYTVEINRAGSAPEGAEKQVRSSSLPRAGEGATVPFLFTRTGDTSAALTAQVDTWIDDTTTVQNRFNVEFPVGHASAIWNRETTDDSLYEGNYKLGVTLVEGAGYTVPSLNSSGRSSSTWVLDDDSNNPTLKSLNITDQNGIAVPIGQFDPDQHSYSGSVGNGITHVTVSPSTTTLSTHVPKILLPDSQPDVDGHQVALKHGDNLIPVIVMVPNWDEVPDYLLDAYSVVVTRGSAPSDAGAPTTGIYGIVNGNEGNTMPFLLGRTGDTSQALTVLVDVSETGGDMVPQASRGSFEVEFPAGKATAFFRVPTDSDEDGEEHSTITVALVDGDDFDLSLDSNSANSIVEDNDVPDVTASFSVDSNEVQEGEVATVTITVKTDGPKQPHNYVGNIWFVIEPQTVEAEEVRLPDSRSDPAPWISALAYVRGNERKISLAVADLALQPVVVNGLVEEYRYQMTVPVIIVDDERAEDDETFHVHVEWLSDSLYNRNNLSMDQGITSSTITIPAHDETPDTPDPVDYITVVIANSGSAGSTYSVSWNDTGECVGSRKYEVYLTKALDNEWTMHSKLGETANTNTRLTVSKDNFPMSGQRNLRVYCGDMGRTVGEVPLPSATEDSVERPVPGTYSSRPALTSLSVSPGTLGAAFKNYGFLYSVLDLPSGDTQITLYATARQDYTISWNPAEDADANTPGHQVDLTEGLNRIVISVDHDLDINSFRYEVIVKVSVKVSSQDAQQEQENSPAQGSPIISGTPQVGETLSADTSGISDADGLTGVSYSYQWVSNDGTADSDIQGATSSSYTLVTANQGNAIKVKVSFTDDNGNEESLISEATAEVAPNFPATGAPTITGTVRVGETLTASTTSIADTDGLTNVSYAYQWLTSRDAEISGATSSTYTLVDSDEGKTIKVRVSFTDDAGNSEELTSAATGTVTATPLTATVHDEPASHDGQSVFTFTLRFSESPKDDFSYKTLRDRAFVVTGGEVTKARRLTKGSNVGWEITVEPNSDADVSVVLPVTTDCNADRAICTGDGKMLSEKMALTVSGPAAAVSNSPASGAPTINGTAQVGETLTASTTGIADADGLTNVSYAYQWLMSGDAEIEGATSSTYTLVDANEGKTIKVRVSFTDDAGNSEELTSTATGTVEARANSPTTGVPTVSGEAQVGETLTASTSDIADADGLDNVSFSYQWLADGTDITRATGSSHTLTSIEQGKTIQVWVTFTDDADNEESLTSEATEAVAAAPNRDATGAPTISGTPQAGETLTASASDINDQDGLTNVSYEYQWIAGGSDISGATGSTYTLTASEQGQTIQVRVTFSDDADNQETLTSEATEEVAAKPDPLTVRVTAAAPTTHDGSSEFTFEIEFSEELDLSYVTLRDHAFTVTGGSVKKAQRTDKPSNILWRITVRPDSTGDVTIGLPATTDCDAQGAICTGDGRKLSNSLNFTVSGPGQ